MKKLLFILVAMLSVTAFAQVTTSKIQGSVTDDSGVLPGVNIEAKHIPTGSVSGTVTQFNGDYSIANLRVGGPYTVTFSYVGYKTMEYTDVYLQLGKTSNVDLKMESESSTLEEVVIVYKKDNTFNNGRTGAETSVGNKQIATLPTISRSQADFTRLEPTSSNGSFGGRNDQYNNFSLDGSIFNNPFGLDAATPGGQTAAQPISLDAIEQIQVATAPYDVSLSGFTGAAVNAVTKSGTNTLKGSVYGYYRNQDMTGAKIKGDDIFVPELDHYQTGFTLGGPIVKDKVFFFINAERENRIDAGSDWIPNNGDGDTAINEATVAESDMIAVQDALAGLGYDTGAYSGFTHLTESWKGIAKLDFNLGKNNRLALIYNFLNASQEKPAHPTALGFRGPDSSVLQFENSGYQMNNKINSYLAELNSNLGDGISNKLQMGYTHFDDFRNPLSKPAPAITIQNGQGANYIITGHEPFSINNNLDQKVYQFSNNLNIIRNAHNITLGLSYEKFKFGNSFNLGVFGYDENGDFVQEVGAFAAYPSMDAFFTDVEDGTLAAALANSEAVNTGSNEVGAGNKFGWNYYKINVGQAAIYTQDEFKVTDNLKVTLGLRLDKPLYFDSSELATEFQGTQFSHVPGIEYTDPDTKEQVTFNSSQMPTNDFIFSPRFGFNYDVKGDKSIQLRGGTGIFTGRFPFVWIGNQSGAPNWWFYEVIDPDFQWPKAWKTSIGVDTNIKDYIITLDGSYTKDMNAAHVQNWGLKTPTGQLAGVDDRPVYNFSDHNVHAFEYFSAPVDAFVLTNSDQGYSYNATIKVKKSFKNNLFTTFAYNYMESKDVNSIEAEITGDAFVFNPAYGNVNDDVLSFSKYGDKHRIVGLVSKRFDYGNDKWYTSMAAIYEYAQGGRFNYTYGGDFNGDGSNLNDLVYIPTADEVGQMDFDTDIAPVTEQQEAYEAFISQDDYLSNNRGSSMERYGAISPWRGKVDFKFIQGFKVNTTNSIEFSLDFLNLGNLFNSNWGVVQQPSIKQPIGLKTTLDPYGNVILDLNADGEPVYQFDGSVKETFTNNISLLSRWQVQAGVRYSF